MVHVLSSLLSPPSLRDALQRAGVCSAGVAARVLSAGEASGTLRELGHDELLEHVVFESFQQMLQRSARRERARAQGSARAMSPNPETETEY